MYCPARKSELQEKFEESLRRWAPTQRVPRYQATPLTKWRGAAIGLVFRESKGLLSDFILTLRSDSLRSHAGQVALPGGLLEEGEHSVPLRALDREVFEEVGLPLGSVEWCPQSWDSFQSIFGIDVQPYWGVLKPDFDHLDFVVDPNEVAAAGWVSIRHLFDENFWEMREYSRKSPSGSLVSESLPVFKGWDFETWGLTAAALWFFVRRISGHAPY